MTPFATFFFLSLITFFCLPVKLQPSILLYFKMLLSFFFTFPMALVPSNPASLATKLCPSFKSELKLENQYRSNLENGPPEVGGLVRDGILTVDPQALTRGMLDTGAFELQDGNGVRHWRQLQSGLIPPIGFRPNGRDDSKYPLSSIYLQRGRGSIRRALDQKCVTRS